MRFCLPATSLLAIVILAATPARGQTASLTGLVSDETGAVIPGATVSAAGPGNISRSAISGSDGKYSITGLAAGTYRVRASAPDLALPEGPRVTLKSGTQTLNLVLRVASTVQQLTVKDNPAPAVTTDAANNASALVLRGDDLQALADDPDDLAADLQALAGPSAGPNGGAIFIDGFSGGQLPSKDSIREIRINQNPFSPEYDTLGFGRIEIFTKPGTDKFRGTLFYNFGDSFWNSRNPYAAEKAPFLLGEYGGNISGPINERASFFLDIQRHAIDNGAIINGTTLDPETLAIVNPYTAVFRVEQRRLMVNPRLDYQINSNNTLTVRYVLSRAEIPNAGVGVFNLVSTAYDAGTNTQTLQVTETAVLGSTAVNETRFQFLRAAASQTANQSGMAIQALGSFNGGAATTGRSFDTQNNYELQNYTSIARGAHSLRFGARIRGTTDGNTSPQNFEGTFIFGGGLAPSLDANDMAILDASGHAVLENISSIERYRRTLEFQKLKLLPAAIRSLGGGATQFSINAGNPVIRAGQVDLGAFIGDDWRVRSNLTLSFGFRYETQTNIHDHRDFAPRVGLAWAPGVKSAKSRPKTVIRAGFGIFYDRFALANTITAQRYNGIVQQEYVVANPDFFPIVPPVSALGGTRTTQTIQEISSTMRAPYMMQSAGAIERQLPFNTTISFTYAYSHGLHLLRSRDINAPLPASGAFPLGIQGPVFLMESSGLYNQNQWITNVNSRVNRKVSLFGSYIYNRARSNTNGLATFPANPYSMEGEYGPASTDIHHRATLGGMLVTKWDIRLSPLLTASTGPPFDITVGHDLYGDTLFNGRPGIATNPTKPGLVATTYGLLDPNPTAEERLLSRNYGRGPGQVMMNLRISKTFALGPSREARTSSANVPGGGDGRRPQTGVFAPSGGQGGAASGADHRYSLSVSMSIRNLLNHNNPGAIIGNITSPLFGQANQPAGSGNPGGTGFSEAANNRRLELQMRFNF